MIRLRLFGKFGDLAGERGELMVPAQGIEQVADVYRYIATVAPALHREITSPQVLVAVNQEIVPLDARVGEGDELAILPPVTGG